MIKHGVESTALVQNIDFASTFLDLAGIKIPSDIQGESWKPILEGRKKEVRDAVYYHYYEFPLPHGVKRHFGVRTDKYKIIHFYDDIDKWELYDLEKDPFVMKNLIDIHAYSKIKTSMINRLKSLQIKYDDTHPTSEYKLAK